MEKITISWTTQAKDSLKSIYDFYKKKSLQGAINIKKDLLESPKSIRFSKQYQVDEINPKYRRIVVRDYKVLYTANKNKVTIIDIIASKESPSVLRKI